MPVLDGPTPLRCALKLNCSQSPRTAAGAAAGAGLVLVAPVAVVVALEVVEREVDAPLAWAPPATSTTAQTADSPRAISEAFSRPRLARGDGRPPDSELGRAPELPTAPARRRLTRRSRSSAPRQAPT